MNDKLKTRLISYCRDNFLELNGVVHQLEHFLDLTPTVARAIVDYCDDRNLLLQGLVDELRGVASTRVVIPGGRRYGRAERRRLAAMCQEAFAEAYHDALNAVEGTGVCFIALSGNKVTVKDGRRLEHKPGEPIFLGYDPETELACYWSPNSIKN
ncbi:hypothetical protein P6F34_gp36 [Pseudomonas phage MiCath]|uniref:Uncharacterized protein n=1 Tax=Pseudomonas phage MiCath TaxID=3003729 RepID=A0A9Y1HTK8_9CAUD|nr:hypothetical protein P6F34_gp36 [Pseudomonas phage MiCath]WAX22388.1 hypothetical protein [Pseudomonas phage MiCath]